MTGDLWEAVARLLKDDLSVNAVTRALGVDRRFVVRVRDDLGLPVFQRRAKQWTREEFLAATVELRGGHRRWRGRTLPCGTPVASPRETAYQVSFRLQYGKPAMGRIEPRCSRKFCVAGEHLWDQAMKKAVRSAPPKELPPEATWQGMDLVAVRRALFGRPPYPQLDLKTARFAFRYADRRMSSRQLAARLGVCTRTVDRWRSKGVPS